MAKILSDPLSVEKIAKIGVFFDQVKSLITNHKDYKLDDFFEYLDLLKEHNISLENYKIKYPDSKISTGNPAECPLL